MTRGEFKQGMAKLALRIPDFKHPQVRLDAWYSDLRSLPADVWFICIDIIISEVDQWWSKNLTALVRARLERARQFVADKEAKIREAEEKRALPPRFNKDGLAKLLATIGDKGMPGA